MPPVLSEPDPGTPRQACPHETRRASRYAQGNGHTGCEDPNACRGPGRPRRLSRARPMHGLQNPKRSAKARYLPIQRFAGGSVYTFKTQITRCGFEPDPARGVVREPAVFRSVGADYRGVGSRQRLFRRRDRCGKPSPLTDPDFPVPEHRRDRNRPAGRCRRWSICHELPQLERAPEADQHLADAESAAVAPDGRLRLS